MSIVTIPDIFKEKVDRAELKYNNSIRPIYGTDKRGTPNQIGTCTFISLDNHKFLLTAAHIIDENKNTPLYVTGNNSKFLGIEGKFKITESNMRDRGDDKYDFALMELNEGDITKLGDIHFISEDEMSLDDEYKSGKMYLTIGYPNSKNKSISVKDKVVKSQKYYLRSTLTNDSAKFAELGVHESSHLLLNYDRENGTDSTGKQVKTFYPGGMSGGGLFVIGDPSNLEDFVKHKDTPKLVGMLIEYHEKQNVVVATRISEIVENITI